MGKENRRHARLTEGTESVQVQTEAKLKPSQVLVVEKCRMGLMGRAMKNFISIYEQ
jgi:hypothetical protein